MIIVLGAVVAIGPLTIDMYLPALLSIGEDLHVSATSVQLTLTGMLVGVSVGQLLVGPLSDAVGRRKPLLYGVGLHVLASVLCAVAPNVATLGALRVLQGLGAAAANVVAMAIVRDLVSGVAAAKVVSRLILVLGAAPILAPTLGGEVLRLTDWRGMFVVLALFGIAIGVTAAFAVPETLPPARRLRADLRTTVRAYGVVLRDRSFVGLVLVASLGMGAVFSYVSGSSYVMQEQYGLSEQTFGLLFGAGAVGLIGSAQLNVRLLNRFSPRQIMVGALGLSCVGAVLMLALAAAHVRPLAGLLIPLWLTLSGAGLIMPNASAMALTRHGEAAGTAAAVMGFVQFGLGAGIAPLVGALGATALAMSAVMTISLLGALASMLLVVRAADLEYANTPEPVAAHA
jgi:DHA1 family bicyclomycin/chloramphenicol resistance-like MFS transporter